MARGVQLSVTQCESSVSFRERSRCTSHHVRSSSPSRVVYPLKPRVMTSYPEVLRFSQRFSQCHVASRSVQPTIRLALVGIGQARYEATYSVAILCLRVSKAHDRRIRVLGRSDSHLASVLTFVWGLLLAFGGEAVINALDVGVFVDVGLRTAMHSSWPVHRETPRTSEDPLLCKNSNTTQKSMS